MSQSKEATLLRILAFQVSDGLSNSFILNFPARNSIDYHSATIFCNNIARETFFSEIIFCKKTTLASIYYREKRQEKIFVVIIFFSLKE
jgi:hypothetical protein